MSRPALLIQRLFSLCSATAIGGLVAFSVALWASDSAAYEFYSDNTNDQGGCAQCHTGFRDNKSYESVAEGSVAVPFPWNSSLHDAHLNNTDVGGSCDNCHGSFGVAGRTVKLNLSDAAADGTNAIACMGCHGRFDDANSVSPVNGAGWGAGLRQHHYDAGTTVCANCHGDANPANFTPVGEDVMPPWYGSVVNTIPNPDVNLDPCNANLEEEFSDDTPAFLGLDNDGDGLYDTADTADCAGVTPTPTSTPTATSTATPTSTPTAAATPTATPSATATATATPTASATATATPTATATATPTATPTATATATPTATATATPTATTVPTLPPTPTATATATATPTATATATATPTATVTATPTPTPTPEPGLALQLASGLLGLAVLDKRRRRAGR